MQPRFGREQAGATIRAAGSADGEFVVPLRTPARIEPCGAALEAEQHGWRHRVGVWSGQLVAPPPLDVTLAEPSPRLTSLLTRRAEDKLVVSVGAACETHGHVVELTASTSSPHVNVSPARIRLDGTKQAVALTLTRQAGAPNVLEASLRLEVHSDDLVAARVNGAGSVQWPLRWVHRRPALRIAGPKDGEELHTARGRQALLPLVVSGSDLDGDAGVVLSARPTPGLDVVCGRLAAGTVRPAPVLKAGEDAALQIQVGRDAVPGRHPLEVVARPTDPDVPLNGRGEVRFRLAVAVAPVDVRVRLTPESADWSLVAPVEVAVRPAVVEVVAEDGGPLPPSIDLVVSAEAPVGPVVREEGSTAGAWPARYTLTVPAQAPPAEGVVRFRAAGDQVCCLQDAVVRVRVRPVVLSVAADPVEAPRYAERLEMLLDWLRPVHRFRPKVHIEGEGADEAGCRWDLVARRADGAEDVSPPVTDGGEFAFAPGTDYEVRLSSAYRHTRFSPSDRLPLPVREKTVAPPLWVGGVAGAVALLVLAWLVRPFPVKVLAQPGGTRRALGGLTLGPVTAARGPKLRLSRGVLGQTLSRSRRDAGGARVVLDSAVLGRVDLDPGTSCRVHRGDVIEVWPTDGEPCLVEILSGRRPPARPGEDGPEFDPDAAPEF